MTMSTKIKSIAFFMSSLVAATANAQEARSQPTEVGLRISVSNKGTKALEAFANMIAKSENGSYTDPAHQEIATLLKDDVVQKLSVQISEQFKLLKSGTGDATILQNISQELQTYLESNYPEGLKFLREYGNKVSITGSLVNSRETANVVGVEYLASDEKIRGAGTWTNIALAAEAAVNVVVTANVALASHVAVAAVAIAVVGIVAI